MNQERTHTHTYQYIHSLELSQASSAGGINSKTHMRSHNQGCIHLSQDTHHNENGRLCGDEIQRTNLEELKVRD